MLGSFTAKKIKNQNWKMNLNIPPFDCYDQIDPKCLCFPTRHTEGKCPKVVYNRPKTGRKTKEPEYNAEEGCVRTFLQGRTLKSYLPTDHEGYSLSAKVKLPTKKLELEWVYGYRGRDCRSNLHLLPTGEIVYFIAAVVVIHNVEEGHQRYYAEHNSDIKSIAIHPNKVYIATGQSAGHDKAKGKPHVRVWDSNTLKTLRVIGIGIFDRAVCCVGFSKDDSCYRLVTVDDSREHVLSVWDWYEHKRLAFSKGTNDPVCAAEFHPTITDQIVSCGRRHILFWTSKWTKLVKKPGVWDKCSGSSADFHLCLAFASNGDVLSGDSSGNIHIWGKGSNRVRQAINSAHRGPIFSLLVLSDGTIMSGGGKDGKVISYNSSYKATGQLQLPEEHGFVRALCQGKDDKLFVGTTRNAILHGDMNGDLTAIVQAHTDELWGLATHPNQGLFLTCAYDKQVILWDMEQHRPRWIKIMKDPCHSATFHPTGSVLAIGMTTGRWLVLDTDSQELIYEHTDGTDRHNIIRYSPDGNLIAIASNVIYVYSVSEDGRKYSKVGRCSSHSSFVTHIDWSADSEFLQSNSGDCELLYWNAKTCKRVTSAITMRDTDWATFSCVRGFPVVGIWQEGSDGTDINTVSRSNNRTILATGNNCGKVNLFPYPVTQPKAPHYIHTAHSSNVTSVLFTPDDRRLISTGGRDMSCMQWKVQ